MHGCSVTGGYVYRGSNIPEIEGYYLFADYCTGRIWMFQHENDTVSNLSEITDIINLEDNKETVYISSFGEDANGELYIINYNGSIYKIKKGT